MDMLRVKLVVVGGAPEGDEFRLALPSVLGRSRDASLPLPHPLVSRMHCELFERDDRLFVKDLGSTNGTFVGSERIEESVIHHGDLLTIGTVTFRAFYDDEPTLQEPNERTSQMSAVFDTSTITRVDTEAVGTSDPKKKTAHKRQKAR